MTNSTAWPDQRGVSVGGVMDFADISHHQSQVDLRAYAAAARTDPSALAPLIVMKATEGGSGTDPTFADRWRQAGQLDLCRWAYHFLRDSDPVAQADHLVATVSDAGGLVTAPGGPCADPCLCCDRRPQSNWNSDVRAIACE